MKGLFLETKDQSMTSTQEVYQNIALEDEIETEYFIGRNKLNSQYFNKRIRYEAKNFLSNFYERIYGLAILGKINLDFFNLFLSNLFKKKSLQIILFVFLLSALLIPNITDLSSLALIGISTNKSHLQENINAIKWKSYSINSQGKYLFKSSNKIDTFNNFNVYIPYSLIEHIDNSCIERENANAYIHNNGEKLIELRLKNLQQGCEITLKKGGIIYLRSLSDSLDSSNHELVIQKTI
jgi:hypothetical protein